MYIEEKEGMKRIGIMGGTFNPIHIGHLIMGESIRHEYDLEEIIYIPVGDPPHKPGQILVEARHRYNMLAIAIEDNEYFRSSDMELNRVGKTYTIDTIEELYRIYGNDIELYFIIGGDSLLEIRGWRRAGELLTKCSFIVYRRFGNLDTELLNEAEDLKNEYGAKILFATGPVMGISSTFIRDSIEIGRSVKYLVPDRVLEYIEENHIYLDKG